MPYGETGRCGAFSSTGSLRHVAVGCGARCEDRFARSGGDRRIEHVEHADDVDVRVELRIARADRDAVLRGVMAHEVGFDFVEDALHRFVADVHVHERRARVDVLAPAAAVRPQVVDHHNIVSGGDKRVDEMGADKAGSAGDHDAHEDGTLRPRRAFPFRLLVNCRIRA